MDHAMMRKYILSAFALLIGITVPVLATRAPDGSCLLPWQSWAVWRQQLRTHPLDAAEFALARVRQNIPPHSRVGYVVNATFREFMGNDREVQRYFASQHVLSPAVMRLVHLPDCMSLASTSRILAGISHVLIRGQGTDMFSSYLRELGFVPVVDLGGFVLLARRAP